MKILIQEDKDIAKAHQEYQHFTADDELRDIYEARMKWQLDYNTDIEIAEKKGIEKSIEKEKIETVLNMHKNDFDIQTIKLATNLSEDKARMIIEKSPFIKGGFISPESKSLTSPLDRKTKYNIDNFIES